MSIRTIFENPVRGGPRALLAVCGLVLGLAAWSSHAAGETSVSLPTEGRFHPGRYLPVRVHHDDGAGTITLRARGMLPVLLPAQGARDVVVPWLALSDSASDAVWEDGSGAKHALGLPLRALSDDERLVAFAGTSPGAGQLLFPGKRVVPVNMDLSQPLLEPMEAWNGLDGTVLSAAAFERLDESRVAALLAAGTVVAVRSEARPNDRWPWAQEGEDWVLRFAPAGPASVLEPAGYSPTYEWARGWPAAFRRAVFLSAVLFAVLGAAVLLWRSRWRAFAFTALAGLFAAGFAYWYARQSPMLQLIAGVRIDERPFTQFDLWTWLSPIRAAEGSFPAAGLTRPVFATARQAEQSQARLLCHPDGRPDRFQFHLEPGQSIAFLSRHLRLDAPAPPALSAARGPFADLAAALYLRPGEALTGEYAAHAQGSSQPIPAIVVVVRPPQNGSAREHQNTN